jgi:hypothetical protein
VTRGIQQLYVDAVHGRLRDYRDWLIPVYGALGLPEQEIALAGAAQ